MKIKNIFAASFLGAGLCLTQQAAAHVDYFDLDATNPATANFANDGWINATDVPPGPADNGDGTSRYLGDSHVLHYFKFHLNETKRVTIAFNAIDTLDPAFSLYKGLLVDQGHDNTPTDPVNLRSGAHPKDPYWDTSILRDGQFNPFDRWSMANDAGEWSEVEYLAHKNDSTGPRETLTIDLGPGDYTVAAAGATFTEISALRQGSVSLTLETPSGTPVPTASPIASPSPSGSPAPTTGPIATPGPSASPSPSPSASPRPTPSPANCAPSGKNAKPVVDAIAPTWDAEVGQTLEIPVYGLDCDDDAIDIKVTKAPPGSSLSAEELDEASRKLASIFTWTPSARQANKTYPLVFRALESETRAHLGSQPRKARVRVWPEGGISAGAVSSLSVSRAQWKAGSGQLTVTGKAKFSRLLSAKERKELAAGVALSVVNGSTALVSGVTLKPNGLWTAKVSLSADQVPCAVGAEFGGTTAAVRSVKAAPGTCLP